MTYLLKLNSIVLTVIAVLSCIHVLYTFVGLTGNFFDRFRKKKADAPVKYNRLAVLIAARNESGVIGQLLDTVNGQTYPKEMLSAIVIADNCTDDTAEVARAHGAYVIERFNKSQIGKGYALSYAFQHIKETFGERYFDAYIVVDADNLLENNYVEEMNKTFNQGYRALTSYRNSKNYGTNMLCDHSRTVVVEADEFDRSFHQLHPAISAITAMDADHLDIYGDHAHVIEAFKIYASQVSETLILKLGLPIRKDEVSARIYTYHRDDPRADIHGSNIRLQSDGHYVFDLVYPGGVLSDIKVGALGMVNVENSIAAAGICLCHGVDAQKIKHAIGSFEGARRRLDLHFNAGGMTYIDDYAHHPAELSAAITSIKEIFPGRKVTGIFQPHLYTRTRDFAEQFSLALDRLDKVVLLDIYPAREEPLPGVSSELIFNGIHHAEKVMLKKDELLDYLRNEPVDVLCTFGAGDIDRLVEPIKEILLARK